MVHLAKNQTSPTRFRAHPIMLEYISALDRQCKVNFGQLIEAVRVHQNQLTGYVRLSDVVDEFDRYKVWAANVGAGHSGKSYTKSLDYRLREAKYYSTTLISGTRGVKTVS
jgi:hypothetical protein